MRRASWLLGFLRGSSDNFETILRRRRGYMLSSSEGSDEASAFQLLLLLLLLLVLLLLFLSLCRCLPRMVSRMTSSLSCMPGPKLAALSTTSSSSSSSTTTLLHPSAPSPTDCLGTLFWACLHFEHKQHHNGGMTCSKVTEPGTTDGHEDSVDSHSVLVS